MQFLSAQSATKKTCPPEGYETKVRHKKVTYKPVCRAKLVRYTLREAAPWTAENLWAEGCWFDWMTGRASFRCRHDACHACRIPLSWFQQPIRENCPNKTNMFHTQPPWKSSLSQPPPTIFFQGSTAQRRANIAMTLELRKSDA